MVFCDGRYSVIQAIVLFMTMGVCNSVTLFCDFDTQGSRYYVYVFSDDAITSYVIILHCCDDYTLRLRLSYVPVMVLLSSPYYVTIHLILRLCYHVLHVFFFILFFTGAHIMVIRTSCGVKKYGYIWFLGPSSVLMTMALSSI